MITLKTHCFNGSRRKLLLVLNKLIKLIKYQTQHANRKKLKNKDDFIVLIIINYVYVNKEHYVFE